MVNGNKISFASLANDQLKIRRYTLVTELFNSERSSLGNATLRGKWKQKWRGREGDGREAGDAIIPKKRERTRK